LDQSTTLLIGTPAACRRLEQQLDLLPDRPATVGWVLVEPTTGEPRGSPDPEVLGTIDDLESIVARQRPMTGPIGSIRSRLRAVGVPDRFMPTLEDQLAGTGPRSERGIDLAALLDRPPRFTDEDSIRRVVTGQRVLITGAGGTIGGEMTRIVARFKPAHLALVERSENALFEIDRQIARLHPGLPRSAVLHDVVDADGTLARCQQLRPQVVFHAAARKHVPMMEEHPAAAVDNNLFGTISIVDAAVAVGTRCVVMISTDKAVRPSSIMGATKRLAEMYVQHLDRQSPTAFCIVRFGNVLGSTGSVLDTWSRQLAQGGPLTVTHPQMTRYFMTIPEAAALVIQAAALRTGTAGDGTEIDGSAVYLLDMGQPLRILDLARRYITLHGLQPVPAGQAPRRDGPSAVRIDVTGPRPGEKLHEELAFDPRAMRSTSHPDINIWPLQPPSDRYMREMVETLSADCRPAAPAELCRTIRQLLPEMVPAITASPHRWHAPARSCPA
jgi:FlaA1/EpsC-like NDP-sugar epimerase